MLTEGAFRLALVTWNHGLFQSVLPALSTPLVHWLFSLSVSLTVSPWEFLNWDSAFPFTLPSVRPLTRFFCGLLREDISPFVRPAHHEAQKGDARETSSQRLTGASGYHA